MILYDERPKMRDGVELSCDVYIPKKNKRSPVILLRTPYNKNNDSIFETAEGFKSKGFNFVVADVRGRGESDGNFTPYFSEALDGFDLIKWCDSQSWSDGNVVTWGASYSARIQWLTSLLQPPSLKAMVSIVSPSDPFVENPTGYPSPLTLSWLFSLRGRGMQNIRGINWKKVYDSLPLIKMPEKIGVSIPFWDQYFINKTDSNFWNPLFYQTRMKELNIPVLHISGWYDDEQIGTFVNYENMRKYSNSTSSRENQALIIGPWGHDVNQAISSSRLNFGKESVIDLLDIESKWILKILGHNGTGQNLRVKLFLMGENKWLNFDEWPNERLKNMFLFLESEKGANSIKGDGKLIFEQPDYEIKVDTYRYDPLDTIPYISGDSFAQIGGADDYSQVENREDILIYSTEKVDHNITIAGQVTGKIYVSSDAPDTDFTMKLLDVWPDGYAQRLLDGMIRLKYRETPYVALPYKKNDIVSISIDLWNTFQTIKKDHKLRIEISSSAFPKYARNQNIEGEQYGTKETAIANQKVYHGKKYSSSVSFSIFR
jgi:putative CocE/NonD family hydrolase